jgi:hypothetical protein
MKRDPSRLTTADKEAIALLAVKLYDNKEYGIQGVVDLGDALGLPYGYCEACEEVYPVLDGACLVCGNVVRTRDMKPDYENPINAKDVCKTILESFGNAKYLSEEEICDLCRKALWLTDEEGAE